MSVVVGEKAVAAVGDNAVERADPLVDAFGGMVTGNGDDRGMVTTGEW
jgi:hypothetical protein